MRDKQAKDAQTELEGLHCEHMSALEALKRRDEQNEMTEPDVDQEEGLDVDSLEENDGKQHPRDEPLQWQDLLKEDIQVNIADGVEECDAATKEERAAFLRAISAHTSPTISGLKCWLCHFDRTMSQAIKDTKWNRAQLEKHMQEKVHTRREELINAFNELKIAGCTGSASCPLCPDWSYKTAAKWLVHVERHHQEELWLMEEDDGEENNDDEDSDFENL
ncbi:hypothetical protein J4E83_008793 [Alternaria metachromatica]|uniref:uncharacterized protein n=1 Tax=Alternaria metachromatica TaxID=283354 RepID=UPI0020C32589|nr:uncharacterized protein J4E83_008793 [Alternaria metachromatica]KAI4609152.1 hypothetical protein J4E83_008793 [Alternaria metachromatica]